MFFLRGVNKTPTASRTPDFTPKMALPAGIPALIALAAVNAAALALSMVAHASELFTGPRLGAPLRHLQTYLVVICLTAIYFFVWALLNTLRSHFDAGVGSFAVPFLASGVMLIFQPDSPLQVGQLRVQRWVTGVACSCPAVNYLLAGIFVHGQPVTLNIYLYVGFAWWMAAAIIGPCLIQRQIMWLGLGRGEHDPFAENTNAPRD